MARSRASSITIKQRWARGSRRQFLQRSIALLVGCAALTALPSGFALSDADDTRADAQWARLKRGLDPKTMAGCRKAAERLAPRLGDLLKGPQWESQMFRAVAAELKQAGVYPDRPPVPGAACAAAEAPTATTQATLPGIGPVIAAVLATVAAVIVLIGQIMSKTLEDQAAAKDGKDAQDQVAKLKKARSRVVTETESRDDCTLFAKKPD